MARDAQTPRSGNTIPDLEAVIAGARFRWSAEVVRRLDEEAEWALTSNPTGAAEVVGILLGQSGRPVQIRDCQPVFLLRERDREYALTGPGRREFERKMAEFRWIPERSVIGFYRSHMGNGLELSEEDLGLLRTCFRDTTQLVLLMKLTGDRSCSAKLFIGHEAQPLPEFHSAEGDIGLPRWLELWQYLSTDASRDRSGSKETTKPADSPIPTYMTTPSQVATPAYSVTAADAATPSPVMPSAATAATPPAAAPDVTTPTHVPKPGDAGPPPRLITPGDKHPAAIEEAPGDAAEWHRGSKRGPVFIIAAAALLALLVGYFMLKGSARPKQGASVSGPAAFNAQPDSSRQSDLALLVSKDGDDLRLNWNRNAPVLLGAKGGMLTIREVNGPDKDVPLDTDLLRSGAILYRPVHWDVSFRLVIFGQGGTSVGEGVTTFPSSTSAISGDSNKERK